MIADRQRGFINLYASLVAVGSAGLLWALAAAVPWLPIPDLAEGVNLWAYAVVVLVAMLFAGVVVRREAQRLHALRAGQAFNMALKQVAIVAACVFALMFAIKDRTVSRLFLSVYLLLLTVGLSAVHSGLPRMVARMIFSNRAKMRTLLVGYDTSPETLMPWVQDRAHLGMQIVGYLAENPGTGDAQRMKCLGGPDKLKSVLDELKITQVILLNGMDDPVRLGELLGICESAGCRCLIHNGFASKCGRKLIGLDEGGESFFAVQDEPLEDPINRIMKRCLDIAVSLPVVVLIIPPMVILVWLIQRFQSPGPLFFIRPRLGREQTPFAMLKFRSMMPAVVDHDRQTKRDDERVYPFGRFLRRHSLDEFPQFINVLKGEMTLVGPRPHLPGHDLEFSRMQQDYRVRSLIKPGITGLAQVQGFRGEVTNREKLRGRLDYDLYYLRNWSIWMDLRIIIQTAIQVLSPPKSAY